MSLHYHEIQKLLMEIQPHITHQSIYGIEEMAPAQFVLLFGKEENPYGVYFSFLVPFVRMHHSNKRGRPPHHPFFLALSNFLKGTLLEKASLLNEDRILRLCFRKKSSQFFLVAELFSKFPNCLLLDAEEAIMASLFPTTRTSYTPPQKNSYQSFSEAAEDINSQDIEQLYAHKEAEHRFAKEKNVVVQATKSRLNKLIRRLNYLQKLLIKNQSWEEVYHTALLLQSNLYQIKKGMTAIEVIDWLTGETRLIPLETHIEPAKQIANLFKRSRKLKIGLPFMVHQIEKNQQEQERWKDLQEKAALIQTPEELREFCRIEHISTQPKPLPSQEKKQPKRPYKEFYTGSGLKIWVGRDAKTNDKLTFQLANGRDWWFHVSGCAGSHVILRLESQKDPDENAILDALQLAVAYSKLKNESHIDVIVTQRKYVQPPRQGKPGEVLVSQHKIRQISPDARRLQQIKQRTQPNFQ